MYKGSEFFIGLSALLSTDGIFLTRNGNILN